LLVGLADVRVVLRMLILIGFCNVDTTEFGHGICT
jgi:hypothetical protein